jgi:hypothetical protein
MIRLRILVDYYATYLIETGETLRSQTIFDGQVWEAFVMFSPAQSFFRDCDLHCTINQQTRCCVVGTVDSHYELGVAPHLRTLVGCDKPSAFFKFLPKSWPG